jgi:uncharacterized MnhB-related membrane protein
MLLDYLKKTKTTIDMLNIILAIFLGILMLVLAIVAVQNKNIVVAIIAAGAVSLFASILYLLLAAPDVAMTEAAIGSGLSTIIFFYVLNKIKRQNG